MSNRLIFLFLLYFTISSYAQEESTDEVKIFLDCGRCDQEFLRQNLGNVQFVRDQGLGDVHIFVVTQRNGAGGRSYEMDFIGKNDLEAINYKLTFSTDANMTRDDERRRTMEYLKLGLVRFWIARGTIDEVVVNVPTPENEEEKVEEKDPWNYWLFRVGANGFFTGQEQSSRSNINFNMSARRVTEANKFNMFMRYGESRSTFTFINDNEEEEDFKVFNNNKRLNVSDILSINDHWSYGFFGSVGTSTFSNFDLFWTFRPALEYSFFDYKDSAKKQLTISYRNGIRYNDYIERTVFNETEEYLWEHGLQLGGRINQEWGNMNAEVSFNQFLQDTRLNSVNFFLGTRVRLFKGFNFDVSGSYSITRNQVNIPGGDLTVEELLLQQQQLQSGFDYFVSVGFSYAFGSIYNTIVNPRFDF
ncbi:uncharacterized protein DUF481 [Winogradskyella wandonensis]|uniref:Uncharacterized protein DUF481 n=1 Tax=Winogradskyella wandonensis TaxID=1442586 RepID=A0A4R1KUV4_9FLAO|nr:DUF481 domain-containing protein [Winogradskyella wandonensis]TCK67989.1 uncharacterized protein DUF481 [Winogradskyella wandonensis]